MSVIGSYSDFSSRGGGGISMGGWGSSAGSSRMGMSVLSRQSGSVYGGAGGKGTRISSSMGMSSMGISSSMGKLGSSDGGFSFGGGGSGGGGFGGFSLEASGGGGSFSINEKQTMQNLNDRLARYLERVRTLETANAKLEEQIRAWGLSRTKVSTQDMSVHRTTINDLRSKILAAAAVNLEISVQIDNVKLAADDFRIKFENELGIRQCVEADIIGLRKMMSDLVLAKHDVQLQLDGVKEEIAYLTKNHEEETVSFRAQLSGQVQVEVDAAPSADLNLVIDEIRDQYEALVAKSRRDVEAWFKTKSETVQQDLKVSTEVLQTSSVELKDSQSSMRNLELELQGLLSMKASLEGTLAETEARFSAQMVSLQATVTGLEDQLVKLRGDIELNSQKYEDLLNIKIRLEMEIAEYRRLLEGGDIGLISESKVRLESSIIGLDTKLGTVETESTREASSVTIHESSSVGAPESSSVKIKKVVTVVEEMIDGVVVSSNSAISSTILDAGTPGLSVLEVEEARISPVPE
ncbi:hypothetical protein ANANG_G00043850 [Anguilla anguilla]|uniref:IF rod domain-containing protein n=1 Tax=Anguilla anguilla TaxID=7936 RepID=A0A9D3S9L3_ANGAN|nr:hypothetical protein ANANG_G00043850 [Anguilla anguilla]